MNIPQEAFIDGWRITRLGYLKEKKMWFGEANYGMGRPFHGDGPDFFFQAVEETQIAVVVKLLACIDSVIHDHVASLCT